MKKTTFMFVIVECILWMILCIGIAKSNADRCGAVIDIPTGYTLTLSKDYTISNNSYDVFLSKGTRIIPTHINERFVYFIDSDNGVQQRVKWDCIAERDKLSELKKEAGKREEEDKARCYLFGIIYGVIGFSIIILLGLILNRLLYKTARGIPLVCLHVLVVIILFVVVLLRSRYMSK